MSAVTLQFLAEQLELGEQLLQARGTMFTPQDLPGRYGRVVKAIDDVLEATSRACLNSSIEPALTEPTSDPIAPALLVREAAGLRPPDSGI